MALSSNRFGRLFYPPQPVVNRQGVVFQYPDPIVNRVQMTDCLRKLLVVRRKLFFDGVKFRLENLLIEIQQGIGEFLFHGTPLLYVLFQPLDDLGDFLVLRLEARPVDDQPAGDLRDGLDFHQAVLLQGLAGGDQVDDPLGKPHDRG